MATVSPRERHTATILIQSCDIDLIEYSSFDIIYIHLKNKISYTLNGDVKRLKFMFDEISAALRKGTEWIEISDLTFVQKY